MRKSRIIEGFSGAVILLSLLAMAATKIHLPPPVDRSLHRSIGAALAGQALALAQAGNPIVVITRDTETFRQPALDLSLNSFEKAVRHASGKIATIQRLQADPLRPVEVPAGDFFELIRRAPAGEVIVSLLGPPLLSEEQWRQLRPIKPRIVALCLGSIAENLDLRALFEAGYLHAAVISRPLPPSGGSTVRQRPTFDDLYVRVTAADLSPLLPNSGSSL
jgi:hypothetical protein